MKQILRPETITLCGPLYFSILIVQARTNEGKEVAIKALSLKSMTGEQHCLIVFVLVCFLQCDVEIA